LFSILRLPLATLFVLTGLFICPTFASEQSDTAAPNFTIESAQLSSSLAELRGQVVYVDFWASWCKPCRKSFPWMNEMQQKYRAAGLQVIAINLDAERQLADEYLTKVPADMPIVYDPQGLIAKNYRLLGMPSSYIVDKKGQIRFAHKGFFSDRQEQYEHEINTLLSEQE
jgi:thiol-disulfide isomerase/thioredoxin